MDQELPQATEVIQEPNQPKLFSLQRIKKSYIIAFSLAFLFLFSSTGAFYLGRQSASNSQLPSPTMITQPTNVPSSTSAPTRPEAQQESFPGKQCATDNDCGAFNCTQAGCSFLKCVSGECVLVESPSPTIAAVQSECGPGIGECASGYSCECSRIIPACPACTGGKCLYTCVARSK